MWDPNNPSLEEVKKIKEALEERIKEIADPKERKAATRDFYRHLYLAITGKESGLPIDEVIWLLGPTETNRRLQSGEVFVPLPIGFPGTRFVPLNEESIRELQISWKGGKDELVGGSKQGGDAQGAGGSQEGTGQGPHSTAG